jgi:hypothetical protein
MLDYSYITTDGARIPIAKLPTPVIRDLLSGPLNIVDSDTSRDLAGDVRKRLDLELFIREKGLRS